MLKPVLLLIFSNLFMTFAWYGHLKNFNSKPLFFVIIISWGIAFFEYVLQVPANRIGFQQAGFAVEQLKIIQEVISLVVFSLFAVAVLGEKLRWNHGVSFLLLLGAVYFAFLNKTGGA